jgi:ATP-dependent exoDNAse (exonuclease V) beta subunit|tara:strand:- start:2723 stop:3406 length:684 start_codon:yes stop_codon:yes gene_type:complete
MSLIVKRFDYTKLSRTSLDGKRVYQCPDGNAVASVTTILDSTKDKTHLLEWRKRVGEETAKRITKEASGMGTRMHKYIENYINDGSWGTPGSNPYSQQAFKMAQVVHENALKDVNEIWGSEVGLYFPKIYAGTTDCVGQYKGNPCIIDFKQTNKPKKKEWVEDYFLQLVAYAEAHNEVYGTDIKEGHVFMCSRKLDYQQFDITPITYNHYKKEWWNRVEEYYIKHAV